MDGEMHMLVGKTAPEGLEHSSNVTHRLLPFFFRPPFFHLFFVFPYYLSSSVLRAGPASHQAYA